MDSGGGAVLEALTRALSQDPAVLKLAEKQLQEWENTPGFYSILLSAVSNYSLDTNVRFMAVVYFKNGVDRYWRRNAPNALSEEEKASLRGHLIANFDEPVCQIAIQLSVLIGKIARLDCPRNWSELVPCLLEAVRSQNITHQRRALQTFYYVIKALASKRLAADRKVFEELTLNIYEYIMSLWNQHTEGYYQVHHQGDMEQSILLLDHMILTLKILRKLTVFGFNDIDKHQAPQMFIRMVFQRINEFMESKEQHSQLYQRRQKIVTNLTKVLLDFQFNHPENFIPFIPTSLQMATQYGFTEHAQGGQYERFTVNALNLMRAILRCEVYRPAKVIEDTKNPLTLEAHNLKMTFFSQKTLTTICHRLVGHYFPLTQELLQSWDADPENFASDEGGDSWKFSLTPCTENLYLTLMKEFRDVLTPVVIDLVSQHQGTLPVSDLSAIILRDAVYNAVGLASFDLYDNIDFDAWFRDHLLAELQVSHPNYRILRRRVIWLIGNWVGVKLSLESRPLLYEAISPLLQNSEDLVVRIEAAFTLKAAVDDFEFSAEQFLPYIKVHFASLFQVLQDVEECETKMQILHVMAFVIERMKQHVQPHAGSLISYLPQLWEESHNHDMLRCAILTTLTTLVQGLGVLSVEMHPFLLPVIELSTDVLQPPHVYLNEDGLELWLTTLHGSPTLSPELLHIYHNMPAQLDLGTENLRTCLKIIESYIILDARGFLQAHSASVSQTIASMVTDIKSEGIVLIYKVVDLVCKILPEEGPGMFSMMLPDILQAVIEDKDYPMVTTMRLAILSRIILQNAAYFWQFIEAISSHLQIQSSELIAQFLDNWFLQLDNIIQPERKKLSALALCSLITCDVPVILERFGGIISACVETLHDVSRSDSGEGDTTDSLLLGGAEELPPDEMETEHDKRKRALSAIDPVHTVCLKGYVRSQLGRLQASCTPEVWQSLMDLVDPDIATQLQSFLTNTENKL